jgi:hypothetical protein
MTPKPIRQFQRSLKEKSRWETNIKATLFCPFYIILHKTELNVF